MAKKKELQLTQNCSPNALGSFRSWSRPCWRPTGGSTPTRVRTYGKNKTMILKLLMVGIVALEV